MGTPEIDFLNARIAADCVRISFDQHPAFMQTGDVVGEPERQIHVMLDQDDGERTRECADHVGDDVALCRREAGGRFIEQYLLGLHDDLKRLLELALLSIGELAHPGAGMRVQARRRKGLAQPHLLLRVARRGAEQ